MNHPKAAILITGDEITMGIVNDTNGGYLAETLTAMGYEVQSIVIVQDNAQFMIREMTGALERADLLVITGGLGSTFDDITLQTVARYAGRSLICDADYRESLERSFKSRFRRKAPADLERQAYTVEGSTILPNAAGSARGCFLKMGAKEIVVLPGPPMEMKAVYAEAIKHMSRPEAPFMRTVGLVDITEPEIEKTLEELLDKHENVKFVTRVKYYTGPTVILSGPNEEQLEGIVTSLREKYGENIYTTTGEELADVVVKMLDERKKTVSTAESCSGGRLSAILTSVPGVSAIFPGGIVAYSNEAKASLLSVRRETLESFGAVSEETAREMASGVATVFGTEIGLSVSGIAGPSGGSIEKPVGLVCTAISFGKRSWSYTDHFRGDRETIQLRAAHTLFKRLWRILWKEDYTG